VETLTCEAMMPNGWALQSATSHALGTNFGAAFGCGFTDSGGARQPVWATSWGASTRLLGGVIMSHSDDTGLVLPPALAPVQVVIVPIAGGGGGGKGGRGGARAGQAGEAGGAPAPSPSPAELLSAGEGLRASLAGCGLRVALDGELSSPPGARFYAWERRGVPLRLELGGRDLARGCATLRRRTGGPREELALPEGEGGPARLAAQLRAALGEVQAQLLAAARARTAANTHACADFAEMRAHAAAACAGGDGEGGGAGGGGAPPPPPPPGAPPPPYTPPFRMFLAPWADDAAAEAAVRAETRYTLRCFPTEAQAALAAAPGARCFYSGRPATHMALWARAY